MAWKQANSTWLSAGGGTCMKEHQSVSDLGAIEPGCSVSTSIVIYHSLHPINFGRPSCPVLKTRVETITHQAPQLSRPLTCLIITRQCLSFTLGTANVTPTSSRHRTTSSCWLLPPAAAAAGVATAGVLGTSLWLLLQGLLEAPPAAAAAAAKGVTNPNI
jgi:hypothetical protein